MGVVSKLTELAKVRLTLNAAPSAPKSAAQTLTAPPSTAGGGLTAEQLLNELKKAQRSAA